MQYLIVILIFWSLLSFVAFGYIAQKVDMAKLTLGEKTVFIVLSGPIGIFMCLIFFIVYFLSFAFNKIFNLGK
jgi:hypothetical protein